MGGTEPLGGQPSLRCWTSSLLPPPPSGHQALRGQDRGPAPSAVGSGEWVAGSDLGVVDDPLNTEPL